MKVSFLLQKITPRSSISTLRLGYAILLAVGFGATVQADAALPPPTPASGDYAVQNVFSSEFHPKDSGWFLAPWSPTDPGWRYKLSPQTSLWLTKIDASLGLATINVDSSENVDAAHPGRPILGMGTSLEETSVYALSKNHDDTQTEAALKDLIDPANGIGMNLFRLCIGTSDFADGRSVTNDPKNNPQGWYTYQDGGPDSPFSIQHDIDLNIIHVVKLAQDVAKKTNHPIKFFASAWSPPAWMKDSKVLTGGNLQPSMIPAYAAYLRQFVQAYQAQGIPIYAITTNNEHYNNTPQYPSCVFNAQQETELVEAIAKEFAQNNITTKVWILDHNYAESPGARTTLDGLGANIGEADSIAYHHYDGPESYVLNTHDRYPNTGIQFTEGSNWGTAGMNENIQNFRSACESYVSWVTMTTQTPTHIQGPYNTPGNGGGTLSPTLLIRNNHTDTGTDTNPDYYKIPEYYLYGQFMKFIQPDAICIHSDGGSTSIITDAAFKNPDGTIVIVVVNQNSTEQDVRFVVDGSQFVAAVPATSVATYSFKGGLAPSTVAPVGVPVLPDPALPVVTSATTASGMTGTAFSYTITASNSPTHFGAAGLPAGLSVNTATGVISGTPTAAATSSITLSATNGTGTVSQTLTLTVTATAPAPAPVISSATSAGGTVGKAFGYQITASNAPQSFTASGLPGGLSVNSSSGLISGTPTSAGTSSVSLGASNASGTGTATLTLSVSNPPPPIPAVPTGLVSFGWDTQVDLRWSASANATGYNVARSTSPTGSYAVVGNNIATPYFSDTGVTDGTTYYYEVSAVGVSGTSAASAAVSALPHGFGDNAWTSGDIGAAPTSGSADYGSGSYTLTSSGVDIWGRADAFQFMSQPLVGDGTIVARVASVSNTHFAAKAGVMIRAGLAANAANMSVFVSPGTAQGVTAQWRSSAGALSYQTLFTGVTAPYWVKLVRAGSTLTAYRSVDGVSWTLQSTQTISMTGPVYAGLAVSAHNGGSGAVCTATFDSVSILPGPEWSADDIGAPAITGFTAYSNAALTLNAAGADIWGTSDQFHYVYQPASGDCDITVRVTGVENSNHDSKGGVMLRESLAANARQVDLVATPNVGVYMQSRTTAGGVTNEVAINAALTPPCWLRLTRVGNTVTGFTSPDGSAWTTLGSTTVSMGVNAFIGVAATSHDASRLGMAAVDNITVNQ